MDNRIDTTAPSTQSRASCIPIPSIAPEVWPRLIRERVRAHFLRSHLRSVQGSFTSECGPCPSLVASPKFRRHSIAPDSRMSWLWTTGPHHPSRIPESASVGPISPRRTLRSAQGSFESECVPPVPLPMSGANASHAPVRLPGSRRIAWPQDNSVDTPALAGHQTDNQPSAPLDHELTSAYPNATSPSLTEEPTCSGSG
jgi:hypothetical protein